jgi:prenyltransferase beta subunit
MKHLGLVLLCLCVVAVPVRGQTADQNEATVDYLRKLQAPDGGFWPSVTAMTQGDNPGSLRATTSALRALKYFGGQPRDKQACAQFVRQCQEKDTGGFADHPGGPPDAITTAIGLMAVVELKMSIAEFRDAAVKYMGEKAKDFEEIRLAAAGVEAVHQQPAQVEDWLRDIAKLRHGDGTYGKGKGAARATGSAVVAVLRLGGKVEHRDQVVKALKAGQRSDGGFGKEDATTSDLESSYRVVRAFVMLKEKPNAKRCLAFVARCRNDDGGYGVAPGKPSSVSATYFAAIITHWLAEKP